MYKQPTFRKTRKSYLTARLSSITVGVTGLLAALVIPMTASAAGSTGYTLFGDAKLVNPGDNSPTAAQIESSTAVAPGYGGVDLGVPSSVTDLNSLNNLATDYMFTKGTCGGGAPRFSVTVTTPSGPENLFVYLGPAPSYQGCPQNVWANTGNLASPTNLVDASQLGGTFYEPYAAVQAAYGSDQVTDVSVVVDADWFAGTQTLQVDNVQVNGNTVTFEGKDSCKNNGWQQFSAAPGPFKNQGDCVSYFVTSKN